MRTRKRSMPILVLKRGRTLQPKHKDSSSQAEINEHRTRHTASSRSSRPRSKSRTPEEYSVTQQEDATSVASTSRMRRHSRTLSRSWSRSHTDIRYNDDNDNDSKKKRARSISHSRSRSRSQSRSKSKSKSRSRSRSRSRRRAAKAKKYPLINRKSIAREDVSARTANSVREQLLSFQHKMDHEISPQILWFQLFLQQERSACAAMKSTREPCCILCLDCSGRGCEQCSDKLCSVHKLLMQAIHYHTNKKHDHKIRWTDSHDAILRKIKYRLSESPAAIEDMDIHIQNFMNESQASHSVPYDLPLPVRGPCLGLIKNYSVDVLLVREP